MRFSAFAIMVLLNGIAASHASGADNWRLMRTNPEDQFDPPRETANLQQPVVTTGTGHVADMTGSAAFFAKVVGGPVFHDGSAGDIRRVIPLAQWRGKHVRLTLRIKSEGAISAHIQNGIAVAGGKRIGGRMIDTANLNGTKSEWQLCQIVRDVPADATNFVIDLHLYGKGMLWVDDVQLAAAGDNAAPVKSNL